MELPAPFGRYTLRRLLGQGGAGRVYEAELSGPAGFRKRVALKVLGDDVSQGTLEGLKREARIGGILKHPNLVDTYDFGEVGGRPYIAMELVDGASLAAMLRRGPLAPTALLDLAGQLCAGLSALHAHGLVHRDLKPGNVLVDRTGLAKIGDFGVAQSGTDEAPEGSGTIGYMAPEQIEAGAVDARSDLFSLGVVMWEALTAERLLHGGIHERASRTFAIDRHIRSIGALERVDALLPGIALPLGACFSRDPLARPAGAADLWVMLRDLQPMGADGAPLASRAAEVVGAATGSATPRGATSRSRPRGRVPSTPDAFFGRRRELAALSDLTEQARAITVKGPGGIGKSRLTLEFARLQRNRCPGGAWWVSLAEASSPGGVALAVARVFDRPVSADETACDEVGQALAGLGRALLVLDDADPAAAALADTIDRWLDAAPDLRIVSTCRTVLHTRGERIVEVGPLSRRAAVDLLRNRVGARGMAWGDDEVVAELADRLDRLPLALELAAGRSGALGPRQMLARIDDRFRLLGKSDRADRRTTLRAVLESSFATLQPWEQSALAQLSVFRGGFRLEEAEEVVDLSAHASAPWMLDVLDRLWETSLVRSQAIRGQPRFHLLESVRAFAAAALEQSGTRDLVRRRHARAYVRFDEDQDNPGRPRIPIGERVLELDNLVAAFDTAAQGDGETAAHLALAANLIVRHVAPVDRAIARTDDVLARFALPPLLRTRLLASRGILLADASRLLEAERDLRAAAEQYVRLGERWRRAAALNNLGAVLRGLGRPDEARAQYEAVIAIARPISASLLEASAEANLGALDGRPEVAEPRLLRAASLLEAAGPHRDSSLDASVLSNLALCALMRGDVEETIARAERALETCRTGRLRRQGHQLLLMLAAAAELGGDPVARRNHLDAALRAADELGDPELVANALSELARWALDAGLPTDARRFAERAVSRLSGRRETPVLHVARAWLGEALVRAGDREGYALLDDADRGLVAEPHARAHVLARYGRVALHASDRAAAVARLEVARTLGPPSTPVVARELDALERALGEEA